MSTEFLADRWPKVVGTVVSVFPLGAAVTLADLEGDVHPLLAELRAAEPVSWLPVLDGWLVTRHDLAVQVMRDAARFTVDDPRFSTAAVVGPSMLSLDGAEHTRHRAPFGKDFRPGAVRTRFESYVTAETSRLVDAVRPTGAAELRRDLAGPLAVAVIARALGLGRTDTSTVLSWYDAIVAAVTGITGGDQLDPMGVRAFDELRARLERTIAQREPTSLLAAAADEDSGLRVDEAVSNAAVLMFGGIETTEGMISNAALHLLTDPERFARVREHAELVDPALEESLRLEPAAAVVDRYATEDVELAGAPIRRGDLVRVSLAAANRDPAVFADPDAYDIDRPNVRQHLAFAHGSHFCVGADLARLEARAAIRELCTLPGLRLDSGAVVPPGGLVFRKPPTVRVRWEPVPSDS